MTTNDDYTEYNNYIKDLVNKDLRKDITEEDLEELYADPDTWRRHLIDIKVSIESQMSRLKSDIFTMRLELDSVGFDDWMADKHEWRASTLRLKGNVEMRLNELKYLEID